MEMLQLSKDDYISYVTMSKKRRLLVEGNDDKRLFDRLFDVLDRSRTLVDVDDANMLIGFEGIHGNREKVEIVCRAIMKLQSANKLVGFVDREFRGFTIDTHVSDDLSCHKIDGRLVWTRGHSIENYYFDFETLREPISTFSTTTFYSEALNLFEQNFETIIRLACAASLTGFEIENYKIIKSIISWKSFIFQANEIALDLELIKRDLVNRRTGRELLNNMLNRMRYWVDVMNYADLDTIRWLCHGHLGLTFLWTSYKSCVYHTCIHLGSKDPEREVSHALEGREEIRFNACAQKWIERSLLNSCAFPFEVLTMLGITT